MKTTLRVFSLISLITASVNVYRPGSTAQLGDRSVRAALAVGATLSEGVCTQRQGYARNA